MAPTNRWRSPALASSALLPGSRLGRRQPSTMPADDLGVRKARSGAARGDRPPVPPNRPLGEMHRRPTALTIIDIAWRCPRVLGDTVIRQNHVGDQFQFGMLLAYLEEQPSTPRPMHDLDTLYRAAKNCRTISEFADRARELVVKLQVGDLTACAQDPLELEISCRPARRSTTCPA